MATGSLDVRGIAFVRATLPLYPCRRYLARGRSNHQMDQTKCFVATGVRLPHSSGSSRQSSVAFVFFFAACFFDCFTC